MGAEGRAGARFCPARPLANTDFSRRFAMRYLAGRLRRKSVGLGTAEVQFRDTAHGCLAWAVASIVGEVLLASPASSLLGSATGGAVQAAASSAQSSPMNNYADVLLRSDNRADQQSLADTRGEIARLLTTSFHANNDVSGADRDYLVKTVAARTGLSQADAEKRVNDVITQAKADLDKARKAAMHTAILANAVPLHRCLRSGCGRAGRRRCARRNVGQTKHARNLGAVSLSEPENGEPQCLSFFGCSEPDPPDHPDHAAASLGA